MSAEGIEFTGSQQLPGLLGIPFLKLQKISYRHPLESIVYKTTQPQEHYHLGADGCSYLLGWTPAPPRRRHMALQLAECSLFRQRNGCFRLMGDVVERVGCWIHSCLPRQSGTQVPWAESPHLVMCPLSLAPDRAGYLQKPLAPLTACYQVILPSELRGSKQQKANQGAGADLS